MTRKDIYQKTYPLNGCKLNTFEFGRDLNEKEIEALKEIYGIYHFASKLTKANQVLIGHGEFDSVEFCINVKSIHSYMKFNGITDD